MITSYNQFSINKLNENVQLAKNYLKKVALAKKKEKDEKATLNPEETRRAENNPTFLKIKEMLRDNPGYVYTFVKFFFEEEVSMEELESAYIKLKEYRQSLNQLSMTVDKYGDVTPTQADPRKGFEILLDDIAVIELNRTTKKFVDHLPGDFTVSSPGSKDNGAHVPSMRKEYASCHPAMKEKIAGIAKAFDEFGKEPDGTIDHAKNRELQDLFFEKIRRYRSLAEVITAANNYIKAACNSSMSKFLQSIQKVNVKYGKMNGAEVVFDESGVLIVEIRSFQANKDLNANTSHCIASSSGQWDNYVGGDSNYNKQYYIYNFNLPPSDNNCVIGITIQPGQQIRAAHRKDDGSVASNIKTILREWEKKLGIKEDLFATLEPMTNAEVESKKKRVIANKEIIKPNLTLSQAKKYMEEGADPNAQQGKPLSNAVSENNIEKIKFLLEQGSIPNIGNVIKFAQNLEVIKLLVDYGSNINNEVFANIIDDYDAVKYVLDAGIDPNFEKGLPLRTAATKGRKDVINLLLQHGASIEERRFMVIKWALEWGNIDIAEFLFKRLYETRSQELKPGRGYLLKNDPKNLAHFLHWTESSDKMNDEQRKLTLAFLNKMKDSDSL